jgi:hypothetical protein
MRPISPPIDPIAHRAAIDALEGQRAAYRRFARLAEAQQGTLAGGDADQVAEFTDGAHRTVGELEAGARNVRSLVDSASQQASEAHLQEIERMMESMMAEARNAETAIRNLTTQLEAWRDAYGRQLTDLGIVPGTSTAQSEAPDAAKQPYAASATPPRILDRRG